MNKKSIRKKTNVSSIYDPSRWSVKTPQVGNFVKVSTALKAIEKLKMHPTRSKKAITIPEMGARLLITPDNMVSLSQLTKALNPLGAKYDIVDVLRRNKTVNPKKKIAKRGDVSLAKKEYSKAKYGNVTFADPTNDKYPIDTYEHVRAAISYFGMPKNNSEYPVKERKEIAERIYRAAKRHGISVSDEWMSKFHIAIANKRAKSLTKSYTTNRRNIVDDVLKGKMPKNEYILRKLRKKIDGGLNAKAIATTVRKTGDAGRTAREVAKKFANPHRIEPVAALRDQLSRVSASQKSLSDLQKTLTDPNELIKVQKDQKALSGLEKKIRVKLSKKLTKKLGYYGNPRAKKKAVKKSASKKKAVGYRQKEYKGYKGTINSPTEKGVYKAASEPINSPARVYKGINRSGERHKLPQGASAYIHQIVDSEKSKGVPLTQAIAIGYDKARKKFRGIPKVNPFTNPEKVSPKDEAMAVELYKEFHDYSPNAIVEVKGVPDFMEGKIWTELGGADAIQYKSDKWHKGKHDYYKHDFAKGGKVLTNPQGNAIVIYNPNKHIKVKPEGIVG